MQAFRTDEVLNTLKIRMKGNEVDDSLQYVLANKLYTTGGMFLEFGVGTGSSINKIAKAISPFRIYGFDSFNGYETIKTIDSKW